MYCFHSLLSNDLNKEDSSLLSIYLATQASWNFPLFIVLSLILVFYLFLNKIHKKANTTTFQKILFISGIIMLYLMIGSPLLSLSYLSFSFHMIQMSIVFFIVPPLILLGLPTFSLKHKFLLLLKKCTMKPLLALIIFAILFLFYHVPFVLTIVNKTEIVKNIYLLVLFILAFMMWSPIASHKNTTKTDQRRFSKLSSYLIMPACLFFIMSALLQTMNNPFMTDLAVHLCLPVNYSIQFLPFPFNTKYDQIMSGILMISIHKLGIVGTLKVHDRLYTKN